MEQRREIDVDQWCFEGDGTVGVLRKVPVAIPEI